MMTKLNFKTSPQISKNMKLQSHGKSKTEDLLAHALWKESIRYRRNYKALPGKPDIAITKYKIAIFVDGEFWHGFNWEEKRNVSNIIVIIGFQKLKGQKFEINMMISY